MSNRALMDAWWSHVKQCDACLLTRPHCDLGVLIYRAARAHYRPPPRSIKVPRVRVQHKDLILRSAP
jgi:hypothetical protein